jgi:hypothetical protein
VGILSFPKSGHVVERDGEDGRLAADLLHGSVVALLVLQRGVIGMATSRSESAKMCFKKCKLKNELKTI